MGSCVFLDKITVDKVKAAYARKQYPFFDTGEYNVNLFGIRANESVSNTFNDAVCLLFKKGGQWVLKKYEATTDPGSYYRLNPCNANGTAILNPGYYKGGFRLGYHQGKYKALVQNKPLPLWRDNNKDNKLDRKGQVYTELAGINIHRASPTGKSIQVDKWSAGCQVIASIVDWNEFISIINTSAQKYGQVFSYALFTEEDFFS